MRLLLDTHAFLWWQDDDRRLRASTKEAITTAPQVFVSIASAWELAIKIAVGKLHLDSRFEEGLGAFKPLPIGFDHTEAIRTLPHHHRDPFDRMLIAQALVEGLTLVTHDRRLEAYRIPILWT